MGARKSTPLIFEKQAVITAIYCAMLLVCSQCNYHHQCPKAAAPLLRKQVHETFLGDWKNTLQAREGLIRKFRHAQCGPSLTRVYPLSHSSLCVRPAFHADFAPLCVAFSRHATEICCLSIFYQEKAFEHPNEHIFLFFHTYKSRFIHRTHESRRCLQATNSIA